MNPAETLLNFIVHNTDLYMRTKRGETPAEHTARWTAAFEKLSPWLKAYKVKVLEEAEQARLTCVVCQCSLLPDNVPPHCLDCVLPDDAFDGADV